MMLPDDVLQLVRAFSRPRMRFYKEYRLGLTELGYPPQEHLIALRDRLCESDAPLVFAAFLAYKEVSLFLRQYTRLPYRVPYGPQLYYVTYHAEMEKQQRKCHQLEQALTVLLAKQD